MPAKKLEDYKAKGQYNYPNENINPKLKENKEWYLAQGAAMMHYFTSNNCEIPFDFKGKASFKELNAYAQGKQGNIAAKRTLLKEAKDGSGKFITKMKDVWATYDVLPEMFDVIRAFNQKQDYEINSICTDTDSVKDKNIEKAAIKFLLKEETKDLITRASYKANSVIPPEQLAVMSDADVDMIFDTGGYVMQRELASIAACDKTKLVSGYKGIENLCNDDLIKYGIAGIKTYIDASTNEVKLEHIDFLNSRVVVPFSHFLDFRDITRMGILKKMTIAQVKEVNKRLTQEEILKLVDDHIHMNPEYAAFLNQTGQFSEYGVDPMDKCVVWVLDFQFLSADTEAYLKTKHSSGNGIFKPVKNDYKLNAQEEKKGAKLKKSKTIYKHHALWVVGTNMMLDYGKCTDVVYYGADGNKTPRLDYFLAKTGNASLIERCIPHVDDINLNTVKLRNAVATLPPAPRMVIQQQLLDNVFLNGIKQQPEDLIQTLIERGYLVVNGVDDHGRPVYQNSKAIEFIQSGLAEDLALFNNLIADSINRLRQVLGLPEGLDGTAGNPYQGKGKLELAASASSNALYPTLGRLPDIFQPAFDDVVKKWQILAKDKSIKVEYSALGSKTRQILTLGKDFTNADFNIELVMAATEEQKQFLLAEIGQMNADYKSSGGATGASKAEYLMLYQYIMAGKITLAMYKMAQIEKRREALTQDQKTKDQQFNIESQNQSMITSETEKRKTMMIEETEKRKTVLAVEAQKRKTAAVSAYLKSFDMETKPIPQELYEEIMEEANGEIASTMSPEEGQIPPEQMQGQEQMMPQM